MKFEIKNRWSGELMFTLEGESWKIAFEAALKNKHDFTDSDFKNFNFNKVDASFVGARFVDASFVGARFVDASFVGASFDGASFVGARFDGASFVGARFVDASFDGARFDGARFVDASFDKKSFDSLPKEYLIQVRDDLWAVLSSAPKEVEGLRLAIIEGRINGSQYEGDCTCLVGTIANVRGCKYTALDILKPNSKRNSELWFINIKKGDTPETNQFSNLALEWCDQWLKNMREAFSNA